MTKKSADKLNLIIVTALATLATTFSAEAIGYKLFDQHQQIELLKRQNYDGANRLRIAANRLQDENVRDSSGYLPLPKAASPGPPLANATAGRARRTAATPIRTRPRMLIQTSAGPVG